MKKVIDKFSKLPTFLQIIINLIILASVSCVLIFVKNESLRVVLVLILMVLISIIFISMSKGYTYKYQAKLMKKGVKININKDFNQFKSYLAKKGYKVKIEHSSLINYSYIKNDTIKITISFVNNFNNYIKYIESLKDKNDNLEVEDNKKDEAYEKISLAIMVVIFKEVDEKIKEYCLKNTFTVSKFGLLFYYYENETINSYYNSCKNQNIIDEFMKVIGEMNEEN